MKIKLTSSRQLVTGDRMTLGKRAWKYIGGTLAIRPHEQDETLWANDSPAPGAVDKERVMAHSEVTALLRFFEVERDIPEVVIEAVVCKNDDLGIGSPGSLYWPHGHYDALAPFPNGTRLQVVLRPMEEEK